MIEKNYGVLSLNFFDRIVERKREEMLEILKNTLDKNELKSVLDIGTTEDDTLKSSNFFVKKFSYVKDIKSISNQDINKKEFSQFIKKSITENFSEEEINKFKSDLVVSSATLEHVGNFKNQTKMIENIINLSNKFFFITTPYRFFPIDYHTKIPFLHFLPKKLHRKILSLIGLKEYAKEENLNLLDFKTIDKMISYQTNKNFEIKILNVKLFGLISNILLVGKKINL